MAWLFLGRGGNKQERSPITEGGKLEGALALLNLAVGSCEAVMPTVRGSSFQMS